MQKPVQLYPNDPCVSTERKRIPENQSLNQLFDQSVSDSRGTGVFKLLKVKGRQKTEGEKSYCSEKVYF